LTVNAVLGGRIRLAFNTINTAVAPGFYSASGFVDKIIFASFGIDSMNVSANVIAECKYGLYNNADGNNNIGRIVSCGTALNNAFASQIGEIVGCATAVNLSSDFSIDRIAYCDTGIVRSTSTNLRGTRFEANNTDIRLEYGWIYGYGVGLGSPIQVTNYNYPATYGRNGVCIYDPRNGSGEILPGRVMWWCQGGYGKSEDYNQGVHGTPPVQLAFVHRFTWEDVNRENFIEWPIHVIAGVPLTVRVYLRKLQNGMTMTPYAALTDPTYPWDDQNERITSQTMEDNTNWQTLTLTYNPPASREIRLRIGGMNASGTLFAAWAAEMGSGGGGGAGGNRIFGSGVIIPTEAA